MSHAPSTWVNRRAIEDIIAMVASQFNLHPFDLTGRDRIQTKCVARNAAMLIAKRTTGASLTEIGSIFGRDHSSVLACINAVEDVAKSDLPLLAFINASVAAAQYRALLRDQGGDDVLAIAMRIVRNPRREAHMASTRDVTALAMTVLDLWEVASAAEAAFAAMDPETLTVAPDDLPRVAALRAAVLDEINALAGPDPALETEPHTQKETSHGSCHS